MHWQRKFLDINIRTPKGKGNFPAKHRTLYALTLCLGVHKGIEWNEMNGK